MTPRELHEQEPGLTRAAIAERLGLSLPQVQRALRGEPRVPGGGRRPGRTQTEAVMVRFSPKELAAVDAARGERPRAEFVREAAVERARKG